MDTEIVKQKLLLYLDRVLGVIEEYTVSERFEVEHKEVNFDDK